MSAINDKNITIHITIATVTISVLLIIFWSVRQVIIQPDLGALWTDQGIIYYAHQLSGLQVGDQILSIDGIPLEESGFPYYYWQQGDTIQLEISRNDQLVMQERSYSDPAPPIVLLMRLSLTAVATVFWGVGVGVTILSSPRVTKQTVLLFLWCQTLGTSLALGTATGQIWAGHLANVLTWWAIALAIHLHLHFPIKQTIWRNHSLVFVVYGLATVGSAVRLLIATEIILLPNTILTWYAIAFYSWALIGLTLVMSLLIRAYRRAYSAVTKRQVGMVTLSGLLAGIPLLSLSVFPKLLLDEMFLPVRIALLFLIVIPVGYGYAIGKYQFIRLELYVSRSITVIYVTGLLCVLYFGLIYLIQSILYHNVFTRPLVNLFIILSLAVVYNPLFDRLQKLVDRLLYGGWYSYTTVVSQVTHRLEETTDIETLAETLGATVQRAMHVHWVCLLWRGQSPGPSVAYASKNTEAPFSANMLQHGRLQNIFSHLQQNSQPLSSQTLLSNFDIDTLSDDEKQLLRDNVAHLWVPIRGLETSLGLLILGPKHGGDLFNTEDIQILNVVSRQASVIFQNVQLISELEEKARENERYQKKITHAREEERKRIARELHDQVIQHLIGLKYQIAQVEEVYPVTANGSNDNSVRTIGALQEQINKLIDTTRHLCQDLRPAALDLGLVPSIRSIANRFEVESNIEVNLSINGDREISISEEIALCLFQCTGEALANIRKHASATQIVIDLSIQSAQIRLAVIDNGIGFVVPRRLGQLMEQNHFGLVGVRERIDLLNGTFEVKSAPASGTCLEVMIPLSGLN